MSCSNNTPPCNCGNNPCGCGISSDEVVYQGPNLNCTGVSTCDTLTEAIEEIDGFICSPEMVQTIINNILNNINLYNQFVTIVNNTVDCNTVWDCIDAQTTTTTTTICPCTTHQLTGGKIDLTKFVFVECDNSDVTEINIGDITEEYCIDNNYPVIIIGDGLNVDTQICCTTTTTTTVLCTEWNWQAIGDNSSSLEYIDCSGTPVVIPVIDVTNNSGVICVQNGNTPVWNPIPSTGTHILSTSSVICPTTTSTTTITPECFCYTIDSASSFNYSYTTCDGILISGSSPKGDIVYVCAQKDTVEAVSTAPFCPPVCPSLTITGGITTCTKDSDCEPI